MSDRAPYVAANWKMHKTRDEALAFVDALTAPARSARCEVVVCPPFTSLAAVAERVRDAPIKVAGQSMHEAESGAFTGEVSAPMLLDAGARAVVLGHSERRQQFCETDEALSRKVEAALTAGLEPILCVGESEAERDRGATEAVVEAQLRGGLGAADPGRLGEVVVAYEPVWAIGTGRSATSQQAQEACAAIRETLSGMGADAEAIRVVYGGSVKPGNAAELLGLPDVDGALVGGAALDPEQFAAIVEAA